MKNNTKEKIFYAVSILLLVIVHTTFKLNTNDDIYFGQIQLQNLSEWLTMRYNEWSSRLFIEVVLVLMLKLPSFIWCLLNSCMLILISYCISYLFTKNNFKDKILSLFLVCLYPLYKMNGAGWYATTLNYLWPLALGLFSLLPIKNAMLDRKDCKFMQVLYSLSLLFACNQEQMCALVLGFYIVFTLYLCKQKRLNNHIIFQCFMASLSIIFILTSPGNDARSLSETLTWYPEFENFNLIEKLIVGFLSTISKIILSLEIPFILLLILLPYLLRKRNFLVQLNSYIPIFIVFIFRMSDMFLSKLKIYEQKIIGFDSSMILVILPCFLLVISIIISLYFIFSKTGKDIRYLIPLVFIAGLFSRMIMSFSPTVYASGDRTYIFYDFSIIMILVSIISSFIKKERYVIGLLLIMILVIFQIVKTVNMF